MNELKRLSKYLETVRQNIKATAGELKEFWLREEKRTDRKIKSLV